MARNRSTEQQYLEQNALLRRQVDLLEDEFEDLKSRNVQLSAELQHTRVEYLRLQSAHWAAMKLLDHIGGEVERLRRYVLEQGRTSRVLGLDFSGQSCFRIAGWLGGIGDRVEERIARGF